MKIPRNAPCTCGSGKKYKKCCGDPVRQEAASRDPVRQEGVRQPLPWTLESAISGYDELVRVIGELKPPPPGSVRIYRGQSADFGKMLATGMRGQPIRHKDSFRTYSHLISERFLIDAGERELVTDAQIILYWAEAIAQHYGPGSRFLDVTHSLEIALWFALHKTELFHTDEIIGLDGPYDPQSDIVCREQWVRHRKHKEGHGWIYVFDAPLWDGKAYPKHGEVIDLARAPGPFASSPRIRAQSGCLLAALETENEGDLSNCYACEPIAVSWPMRGCVRLNASVHEMFPPPSKDSWYAEFLSIPVGKRPAANGGIDYGQALPVSLYEYSDPQDTADVRRRMISLPLRLIFPTVAEIISDRSAKQELPDWLKRHPVSDATVILVESPVMHGLPRADTPYWNQGLLVCDISPSVDTFNISDQPAGQVSLENVFFEFSAMETGNWRNVEAPGVRMDPLRGLWLVRHESQFLVYFVFQILQPATVQVYGPKLIELDPTGRFVWRVWPNGDPTDFGELPARAFYTALTILRELSPDLKPSAIPGGGYEDKQRGWHFNVPFRFAAAARLIKARDFRSGGEYCFLTQLTSHEPFVKPEERPQDFSFNLDSEVPWPEIPAEELRGRMRERVFEAWIASGQAEAQSGRQ